MEYSIGDLADKYTILLLKIEHDVPVNDQELRAVINSLFGEYQFRLKEEIVFFLISLGYENRRVWELENKLGATDDYREKGVIAEEIGVHNGNRVRIKNEINKSCDSGFVESKSKLHRSYKTLTGDKDDN